MATLRISLIVVFAFLPFPTCAQGTHNAENPFFVPSAKGADSAKSDLRRGSVTFSFDGGTLRCTFGAIAPGTKPHIAMIVVPSSVDALTKRAGIAIKQNGGGSVVIVSGLDGKLTQLTAASVDAWSKARIAEMSGRETSVAENAFVAAVAHTLSTGTPVELWSFDAQVALESGNWCKLFDSKLAEQSVDSFDNAFGGEPFK